MTHRRLEYLLATLIAVAAFLVYVMTMCPTVSFIDSGELAAVVHTLGIAHPTGYPFFTFVGHVFSHLPLGLRPIYQANLMAAMFCAAGLFLFFRFLVFFIPLLVEKQNRTFAGRSEEIGGVDIMKTYGAPAAATIILGFSETYWSQALSIEVYAAHVFFLSGLLFFFSKAIASNVISAGGDEMRYWTAFAFVLGLSFTNHMTTILLAPACAVGFFASHSLKAGDTWRKLSRFILPFLLGFSAYLYLPWRAGMKPTLNWGNPVSLERFFWHIGGKQYRVWMFSSVESALKQFQYFVSTLPGEFAYLPLVLAGIGIMSLLKDSQSLLRMIAQLAGTVFIVFCIGFLSQADVGLMLPVIVVPLIVLFLYISQHLLGKRPILLMTLLLFETCVAYSINYDIHDVDSYFLLAYMTVAIWCGFGVRRIMESTRQIRKQRVMAIGVAASLLIVVAYNYKRVDESKTFIVEDYTNDMFQSIAPNGLIVSYQWDYFVSSAYYFQLVEHVRPDVVVVDKELLRRSWYLEQLETRYPWLIAGVKKEVEVYKSELYKFEHGLPYTGNVIEYRYAQLIKGIFDSNYGSRPIYASPEIEQQYLAGYDKVPSGLIFRLDRGRTGAVPVPVGFSFRMPQKADKYVDGIVSLYSQAYLNHAIYSNLRGNKGDAVRYVERALELRPDNAEARAWKQRLLAP